jgi:hypothetical protein
MDKPPAKFSTTSRLLQRPRREALIAPPRPPPSQPPGAPEPRPPSWAELPPLSQRRLVALLGVLVRRRREAKEGGDEPA